MLHIHRTLVRSALLPAAAVMVISGSVAAVAAEPAVPAEHQPAYTMRLSPATATVRPGGVTTTVISFDASHHLYGYRVDLTVIGLPPGVRATFWPRRLYVGGPSVLTLTTSSASPVGAFTLTISAIIAPPSSDPIGTTTTFALTISPP